MLLRLVGGRRRHCVWEGVLDGEAQCDGEGALEVAREDILLDLGQDGGVLLSLPCIFSMVLARPFSTRVGTVVASCTRDSMVCGAMYSQFWRSGRVRRTVRLVRLKVDGVCRSTPSRSVLTQIKKVSTYAVDLLISAHAKIWRMRRVPPL